MIFTISIFLMGLLVGPFMVLVIGQLLPGRYAEPFAKFTVSTGIKMGGRWLLVERGGGDYELRISKRSDHDDAEELDDDLYPDPGALMGRLFNTPFGLSYGRSAVVTSPLVAKAGEEYGELTADGGIVHPEEQRSLSWYRENAVLSRFVDPTTKKVHEVVNGAVGIPDRAIVNIDKTVKLLSKAGDPAIAQRAATNAEQSEVARKGDQGWKEAAGKFAYLMMGGLLVYIGTAGGGGGGSGARETVEQTVGGGSSLIAPTFDVLAVLL